MNIEQRIEYFQGMAVSFAHQRSKAEKTNSDASSFYDLHNSIFIVGMHILEELQKMQQPKVCKWTSPQWINPDMSSFHAVAGCNCKSVIYYTDKPYCGYCGGKIEIVDGAK